MLNRLNKGVKKMKWYDISLVKLSVAAAVLFVIGIWPTAMNWAQSVNPWYFLIACVVFAVRPVYMAYFKS